MIPVDKNIKEIDRKRIINREENILYLSRHVIFYNFTHDPRV